jgi:hypothetical protein
MKKLFSTGLSDTILSAIFICLLSSCEKQTPEQTFARAVINPNLIAGFAGTGIKYQLENPSVKLTPSGKAEPMTRKEIVNGMIISTEHSFQEVKDLSESEDNREMLRASVAVYEYVLPVYRNDYTKLAELYDGGAVYDGGATGESLESAYTTIAGKYLEEYRKRVDALHSAGKPYADRHGIKVKWDVRTSPSP